MPTTTKNESRDAAAAAAAWTPKRGAAKSLIVKNGKPAVRVAYRGFFRDVYCGMLWWFERRDMGAHLDRVEAEVIEGRLERESA